MLKKSIRKDKDKRSNGAVFLYFIICSWFILSNPLVVFSQWTSNTAQNTPVVVSLNNQKDFSIASDTKGGVFVIWNDKRNNILKSDIYAQRINFLGYPMWSVNGIGVCTNSADQANPSSCEDGFGGVIIAWDDSIGGDRDIYAQKLDSSGNPQWAVNGVPIVAKINKQKNVKIVSDGTGGAIAVWEDSSAGFWDIYAQRINNNGTILWTAAGVPVCTAILHQKSPRIAVDGMGGAYIVWQDRRNGVDYDIYAQHLNSSGTPLWTANGLPVSVVIEKQVDPKIVSDGLGGAIVAWEDKRGGIYYDIYAQRMNSSGTMQWQANGNAVCTADSSQTSLDITSDNISGAILVWRDKRNGQYHDIYSQKINLNGTVAWTLNGIRITNDPLPQVSANVCGDGSGGGIITWQDSTAGNWDIRSQRVSSNGTVLWNPGGNLVSNANNVQTNPKNISDGRGGCIYVWEDFRNGVDDDIYVQHLTSSGYEEVSENAFSETNKILIYPNPINEYAKIYIQDFKKSNSVFTGRVIDYTGREMLFLKITDAETTFDVKSFENGIYFLEILSNRRTVDFLKFIIEK